MVKNTPTSAGNTRATARAQISNRKRNNPVKTTSGLHIHLTKEDTQMANNHMKRASKSLVIRKNESEK